MIAPDDIRAVYKRVFETTLDRYVVQQATTPHLAVGHIASNSYALYFTLIALSARVPETADGRPHEMPVPVPPTNAPSPHPTPSGIRMDVPTSVLSAACGDQRVANKEWRPDGKRNLAANVALFVGANGDLMLSQIDQLTCAKTTAIFPTLPTRYEHTREDISGGMPAVLARGERLAAIWRGASKTIIACVSP